MAFIKVNKKILDPNNTANRNVGAGAGPSSTQTAPRLDAVFGDPVTQITPEEGKRDENGQIIVPEDDGGGGGDKSGVEDPFKTKVSTGDPDDPTGQRNLVDDFDLGEFIMAQLTKGSSFGQEEIQGLLKSFGISQAQDFERRGANVEADVASRGLSASTIPTGFLDDIARQQGEESTKFDADIASRKASADDTHLQGVLQSANIFLEGQNRTETERRRDDIFLLELEQAESQFERELAFKRWQESRND